MIYKSGSIIILRLVLTVAADIVMPVKTGHASAADCYPFNQNRRFSGTRIPLGPIKGKSGRVVREAVPPLGGQGVAVGFGNWFAFGCSK